MTNMTSEILTRQIRMNDYIARQNLDGITHDESLVRSAADGTHINWIVGHIVGIRCAVLPALGQEPVLDAQQAKAYRVELRDETPLLPFDDVVAAFHQSTERMLAGVANATDETYAAKAPFSPGNDPNETIGTLLTKFMVHEGYHLGQTGILRRVAGKPGAIKGPR
ncbi:MAG TPA: DinB family protein [Thermoanaerobaculia bacterium]|nr:DinB family protein [Thermoanaerobaculia bacterium]